MARGHKKAADAIADAQEHLNGTEANGNRAQTIREACREIAALEAERAAIGEQIRKVKQSKIKGELGMKLADFNAALRLYRLENDDRDEFFDTLRETFAALGVGEQLDWLDVADNGGFRTAAARDALRDTEAALDE